MYWIIKKALKSKYLDKVYVSTDSKKYQKLSKKYGAYCPTLRPKNISKSDSLEIDYIIHTLEYLSKKEGFKPDYIVRLQPTSHFSLYQTLINLLKK